MVLVASVLSTGHFSMAFGGFSDLRSGISAHEILRIKPGSRRKKVRNNTWQWRVCFQRKEAGGARVVVTQMLREDSKRPEILG